VDQDGLYAPLQLVAVVFEAHEQHPAAPEHVPAAQWSSQGERYELQKPQCVLTCAAVTALPTTSVSSMSAATFGR
jgi:hypothetical protein